jgi:hypothetical protein
MSPTWAWPTTAVAFLAACALHVAQPRSVTAQQPTAAPDELTQAILRYAFRFDGGNARLLDGRVPDDLAPHFYVPPGTRVLGSVVIGSGVVVLARSSTPPESLRTLYTRALGPRGWKAFDMMGRGGFAPNPANVPLILCREGAQLQVQHSRRSTGLDDLFLNYRDGAGPCEEPQRPVFREMREPSFPTLYAPPGPAEGSSTRCFSRGPGPQSSTQTRTSGTSAQEVLRHYGSQLESAGWRPALGDRGSLAAGAWTRTDGTGTTELKLQVREMAASGPRCYDVQMTVTGGSR